MVYLKACTTLIAGFIGIQNLVVASPSFNERPILARTQKPTDHWYDFQYTGCNDKQRLKIGSALYDVAEIASIAKTIEGIGSDVFGWMHYFRLDKNLQPFINPFAPSGMGDDLGTASKYWNLLVNPKAQISFAISCVPGANENIATADPRPQNGKDRAVISVYPSFFTSDTTRHNLEDRKFAKPDNHNDNSWCAPGKTFDWYQVAGYTMLREMTRLDIVGKLAGGISLINQTLDGKTFQTYGTDYVNGNDSSPSAARQLAARWQLHPNASDHTLANETLVPSRSAANIAASALERYMTYKCKQAKIDIGEIKL